MTDAGWSERLEDAFNRKLPEGKRRRRVRFPKCCEGGPFQITSEGTHATVRLGALATTQNMQANASSFEIWCLIAEARDIRAWMVGHKIHPLLDGDLSPIPTALQHAIDAKWSLDGPRVTVQSVALQGGGTSFSHPLQKVT